MIEMVKQYRTRAGRPVRLLAVDSSWAFGYVGSMRPCMWNAETGKASDRFADLGGADADLIEVKPKITRTYWLVHGSDKYGWSASHLIWDNVEHAKALAANNPERFTSITGPHTVEFVEGEGL